jgi:putative transposase
MEFPRVYGTRDLANDPLERLNREIKRRTWVVGTFPDGESALMPVAARLRYVAGTKWGTRRYLSMDQPRAGEEGDAAVA